MLASSASVHVAERVERVASKYALRQNNRTPDKHQDTLTNTMASVDVQANNTGFDDGLDDLDDILKDVGEPGSVVKSTEKATQPEPWNKKKKDADAGLGVDEEIVITKKRQPAPKLDDQRLLSDPGIPRLRKISKDRLRLKGKGHEVRIRSLNSKSIHLTWPQYGDIARMLNMYQLWLDDLYPRAKFADALAIIEKVGHTKRMQIMRKDWIDEGKPRRATGRDEDDDDVAQEETAAQQTTEDMDGVENTAQGEAMNGPEQHASAQNTAVDLTGPTTDGDPDDDELDALLAESEQPGPATHKALPTRSIPAQDDPFADEMEAMAGMDDMWD